MRQFLLSLVLLLLSVGGAVAAPSLAWQQNQKALELFRQQHFEQGLKLLQQALNSEPDNEVLRKNIVAGYLGAASQLIHAQKYRRAAELLRQGREYDDEDSRLWLLRGIALLKDGDFGAAESELNEAWAMSGDEPQVLQFLGELYYNSDRMDEAIDAWRRALALQPDNRVLAERLAKAERELKVEGELERNYSGHFILSYAENRKADIGGDILDALEEAYTWAGAKLMHYPERKTPVILYTQRQFHGLTASPEWASGLYDGKIRLAIGGLSRVDGPVKALLAHEFMHVMVLDMAGNRVPFWLNEGLAEVAAHEQDDVPLPHLQAAVAAQTLFTMGDLAGSFRKLDPARVRLAYEQSYSFVRYLIERSGWYQMTELLKQLRRGAAPDAAFETVYGDYGLDFATLERDWRRQL